MRQEERGIFKNVDKTLVIIYLILVLAGWLNIYSATYSQSHTSIFDLTQSYGKQALWIGTAFFLALLVMLTDAKFFTAFSWVIYGIIILVLMFVLVAGSEVKGSKSWFEIGGFALQPAEFGKFATSLALAKYFTLRNLDLKKFSAKIIPLLIIGLPAGLILLQNDTGSALVYLVFTLVLYRQGMPSIFLLAGVFVIMLAVFSLLFDKFWVIGSLCFLAVLVALAVRRYKRFIFATVGVLILAIGFSLSVDYFFEKVLEPHQKSRINVLLGKTEDLQGSEYNINQSKIAIGSGGVFGKGYLKGTQTKFNFVPEQSTDFIFCTVGEEWGLVGSTVLLFLYLFLCIRIILIAERQRSDFSRIYGYGVACVLFFHFFVNIGMTLGLLPVIGIPLPFFSYGGSSLWAFTILLFIFIKFDSKRLQLV